MAGGTGITVADINRDGYPDLVAGNHGLNSRFKASADKPVRMYVSDFDQNGTVEQVVTCYNGEKSYPMALRHDLVEVLPYLKKKYLKYESYKDKRRRYIYSRTTQQSNKLEAYELRSSVFINDKNGGYISKAIADGSTVVTGVWNSDG